MSVGWQDDQIGYERKLTRRIIELRVWHAGLDGSEAHHLSGQLRHEYRARLLDTACFELGEVRLRNLRSWSQARVELALDILQLRDALEHPGLVAPIEGSDHE